VRPHEAAAIRAFGAAMLARDADTAMARARALLAATI
jgi:hypothetical protein